MTDVLTPAIASSAVPLGLNDLYWSRIVYPAMNRRAILRGSYGTIPALKLACVRLRLGTRSVARCFLDSKF